MKPTNFRTILRTFLYNFSRFNSLNQLRFIIQRKEFLCVCVCVCALITLRFNRKCDHRFSILNYSIHWIWLMPSNLPWKLNRFDGITRLTVYWFDGDCEVIWVVDFFLLCLALLVSINTLKFTLTYRVKKTDCICVLAWWQLCPYSILTISL